MSEGKRWTVMLWGDSGVGKTTLLTAAVYATGAGRLNEVVDRARSGAALAVNLLPQWRRLSRGQVSLGTVKHFADIPLVTKGGNVLCLRDTRGELAGALETPAVLAELSGDPPDACVFVLEWGGRDLVNQLLAITGVLDLFGDRPCALVFTKCERAFDEGDARWRGDKGWWRGDTALASQSRVIERFGDAVWACSAFGFQGRLGLPAVMLGEFGQLLPFEIEPRGVHGALDWVLGALEVA